MRPGLRYTLYQLPGYGLAAAALALAWRWGWLPGWLALLLFGAWVAKDALLYPLVWHAYRREPDASQRLVGERGVVLTDVAPRGLVRVGGETFRAESDATILAGRPVIVTGARGLVLTVRPASEVTPLQ